MLKMGQALILICGIASFATIPGFAGSAFEARRNDVAGVTIVVRPKPIEPTAKVWEFEITMDTHTKPLTEDLTAVSVIVASNGDRVKPVEWQGDKPGGHHRKGVLKFPVGATKPSSFELQMAGVGGVALRTFQWEVK